QMVADPALVTERANGLGTVVEQCALERRITPGLGDHVRAGVRTDLGLIGVDDDIERGRIDIALLGQDGLQRAYAQLYLGEFRTILMVILVGRGQSLIVPSGG